MLATAVVLTAKKEAYIILYVKFANTTSPTQRFNKNALKLVLAKFLACFSIIFLKFETSLLRKYYQIFSDIFSPQCIKKKYK